MKFYFLIISTLFLFVTQSSIANHPVFVGNAKGLDSKWNQFVTDYILKSQSIELKSTRTKILFFRILFRDNKQTIHAEVYFETAAKINSSYSTATIEKPDWIKLSNENFDYTKSVNADITSEFLAKASIIDQNIEKITQISYFDWDQVKVASRTHLVRFNVDVKKMDALKKLVFLYFRNLKDDENIEMFLSSMQSFDGN